MTLNEIKEALTKVDQVIFVLPNGESVPVHFHVTEVGLVNKHFIDCGGEERKESVINFQLWSAADFDHRLPPNKLLNIIRLSERKLNLENHQIEVEYQSDTIGKYGLEFDGKHFLLTGKKTDCLAKDKCGIPQEEPIVIASSKSSCNPDSGCC